MLARLPRVGHAGASELAASAEDASEAELPVLVLLDDEPPPTTEQVAIDALAEAATPAWQHELVTPEQRMSEPSGREADRPDAIPAGPLEAEMDAAGATPIFRIHQWLAPYSSVIVTVVVIAAAGLLFMVASQPAADRMDYDSAWAESIYSDPTPRTPDAPAPAESIAASSSEPADSERSTLIVAQRPTPASRVETPPRELPEMTLGPPQSYPSTGSKSFEQAFFSGAETAVEEQVAPEAADNETGRYERY